MRTPEEIMKLADEWCNARIRFCELAWTGQGLHPEDASATRARLESAIRALAVSAEPLPEPEIRRNDDGTLDEIVGTGSFHLEQMSATHWWLCFGGDHGGPRVTVNFHSKATIKAYAEVEGGISGAGR